MFRDPTTALATGSLVASVVAIAITIILWRSDVARRRREDAEERRRLAVIAAIELAERTARHATFSIVTRFWF